MTRSCFPLASRAYQSNRSFEDSGHHRATCSRSGVLGCRGLAHESAQLVFAVKKVEESRHMSSSMI